MKLLSLTVKGFRSIIEATVNFDDHSVLIGPNGSGKSALVEAIALALGRQKLVRPLTEHDFHAGDPGPSDRIQIVATLGGFHPNSPDDHFDWFRIGRGIPKWWNRVRCSPAAEKIAKDDLLCVQIGFAARFDRDSLDVETVRYFHDSETIVDPFLDEAQVPIPPRLLHELGVFILSVRRTWDRAVSFRSELFRRAVTRLGTIPAAEILAIRDELRRPARPLESQGSFKTIAERLSTSLDAIIAGDSRLLLRLTSTDSNSVLDTIIPHYQFGGGTPLPVDRHGSGLVSLQTFLLLLECCSLLKQEQKDSFLIIEEPELHLPPHLQGQLCSLAQGAATQTLTTTHSPRVAAFFRAARIRVMATPARVSEVRTLCEAPLSTNAPNSMRKLFLDNLSSTIEAIMCPVVLIPEGRTDQEWLRQLSGAMSRPALAQEDAVLPYTAFGASVGVVPTHDAAVVDTVKALLGASTRLVVLVDGDRQGDTYVRDLLTLQSPPCRILQWPDGWAIEEAVAWTMSGDLTMSGALFAGMNLDTATDFESIAANLKRSLKTNYLAFEEIVSAIRESPACATRARTLLETVRLSCLGGPKYPACVHLDERTSERCEVLRLAL